MSVMHYSSRRYVTFRYAVRGSDIAHQSFTKVMHQGHLHCVCSRFIVDLDDIQWAGLLSAVVVHTPGAIMIMRAMRYI